MLEMLLATPYLKYKAALTTNPIKLNIQKYIIAYKAYSTWSYS